MAQETQIRSRDDTGEPTEYMTEQVVEGTVKRITGAGNFVVYPMNSGDDVRVGNAVKITVAQKMVLPMITVQAREERISSPISSSWAIVVSGHQSIERCRVFYNSAQLSTIDHMGEARSELRMPRDSFLSFHIPDSMELNDAYLVQVKDGDRLLSGMTFGSIRMSRASTAPSSTTPVTTTTTTTIKS